MRCYLLLHGAAHGGWCWRGVAQSLRRGGHEVHTPTFTGLGERSHLLAMDPGLDTFIEDVARLIEYESLQNIVLVGHSLAGSVVSALADRMPQRLAHLVYLDALLLRSGESSFDRDPAKIGGYRERAVELDGVWVLPPKAPAEFGILDPQQARHAASRLTPQPLRPYFDQLTLRHALGNGLPASYIASIDPVFAPLQASRALAREAGWDYHEIRTGHCSMISAPEPLADLLSTIGRHHETSPAAHSRHP